jgi:hypothetical protein
MSCQAPRVNDPRSAAAVRDVVRGGARGGCAGPVGDGRGHGNAHGAASVRMVLRKEVDERGFVFFTNYERAAKARSSGPIRAQRCSSTGGSGPPGPGRRRGRTRLHRGIRRVLRLGAGREQTRGDCVEAEPGRSRTGPSSSAASRRSPPMRRVRSGGAATGSSRIATSSDSTARIVSTTVSCTSATERPGESCASTLRSLHACQTKRSPRTISTGS